MDLRDYLRLLRRGALTIVVTTVLAGLLAVAYLQATPKTYQTTAAVLVAPRSAGNIGELQLGAQYAQSAAATISALIGTEAVLEPAAEDLRQDGAGAGISASTLSTLVVAVNEESSAVVQITASAPDPDLAALIANTVADEASSQVPGLINDRDSGRAPFVDLSVVQAAEPPVAPVAPAPRRITVLFLAVGFALGLAITLLRQSLDNRLRQTEDVTGTTQLPLLATLAREGRRLGRPGVVVRDAPTNPAVEGYRVLRTNLTALAGESRRSVLIVAADTDSLAVRVPSNLAWSMAQADRRVLLVDLDLRHPTLSGLLGVPDSPGAADVLTGAMDLGDVVRPTAMAGLDVVPGGVLDKAPSDLLSSARLDQFVAEAESAYDHVILHAPPLLRFTDAAEAARAVAHTVIVVRSGHTRAPSLTSAVGVLGNVGVTPLGIVLTDARSSVSQNVRAREGRAPAVAPVDGARRAAAARSTRSVTRRAPAAEA